MKVKTIRLRSCLCAALLILMSVGVLADSSSFVPSSAEVVEVRKGLWLGGAPPINKAQSRINTFYRITETDRPHQLSIVLRFEGVVSDDAWVEVLPIDKAIIVSPKNSRRWRLPKASASELSLTVEVPANMPSYLSVNTKQKGKGSNQTLLLETMLSHYKRSSH